MGEREKKETRFSLFPLPVYSVHPFCRASSGSHRDPRARKTMLKSRLSLSHSPCPFRGVEASKPSVNKDRFVILRLCGPFVEMLYRVGRFEIAGSRMMELARFLDLYLRGGNLIALNREGA